MEWRSKMEVSYNVERCSIICSKLNTERCFIWNRTWSRGQRKWVFKWRDCV